MVFKTEKLLIRIAAILGAVGIVLVAILNFSLNLLKTMPEMQETLESSGQEIADFHITPIYYVLTALSILVVVSLFIIANKLNVENYKTMGIVLLVLAIVSYWVLWFVPIILITIAGILILSKGKKINSEIVE